MSRTLHQLDAEERLRLMQAVEAAVDPWLPAGTVFAVVVCDGPDLATHVARGDVGVMVRALRDCASRIEGAPGPGEEGPGRIAELEAEVAALRAEVDALGSAHRGRLSTFASAVETVLTLAATGAVDLSDRPLLREQLDRCHELACSMAPPGRPWPAGK
jgi:hypothetical protein